MATYVAKPIALPVAQCDARALTICHFTTAHSQLKSRSFHREFLPLASTGIRVLYASPAQLPAARRGVRFVNLPAHKGRFGRAFGLPALLRMLIRENANLYHFQDPELLPAAFALKLLFRRRVIFDAYEDFPSAVANKKWIPRFLQPAAAAILARIEHAAVRCFDGVMTADPLTLRRFARRGKSGKLVFYNFPNLDLFPPPHPVPKPFDLVYRGGLSERAGIHVLLEALRLLQTERRRLPNERPPRLLLIGYFDGPSAERELRDRVRHLGFESNVEIRGRLPHESMADTLSQARIGICPLLAIPKFLRNIPVKVFECWACGIPVVATDLPPIRPFFPSRRDERAGLLVPPNDPAALARAISWLLDRPEEMASMGERGRQLVVQRFNNAGEVRKLRRFIARVAAAK